ncbi:uncharacterized protein [Nicotiana tomentosiformis]|uniref:uncharacterized protein n=1 Tax=Nicotiana tomentosiformis TaxID=4098 RepID=UPI00388C50C1
MGDAVENTPTNVVAGVDASVGGSTQANEEFGVDLPRNHPLCLGSADMSGAQLISFQLTGTDNYTTWNRSMRIALRGRNKLGLVERTWEKEKFRENLWEQWERPGGFQANFQPNSYHVNNSQQPRNYSKQKRLTMNTVTSAKRISITGRIAGRSLVIHKGLSLRGKGGAVAYNVCIEDPNLSCYSQILQMLNKSSLSAPLANMETDTSSVFLVSHKPPEWIIDRGATNHMVSDLKLLSKSEEIKPSDSKIVHLPNGDGLHSGRVKEIGKEHDGLYVLISHADKRNTETTLTVKDTLESKKEEDIDLWHMRLGHVPSGLLKKLFPVNSKKCVTVVNKCHSNVRVVLKFFMSYVKIQFNKDVKVIRTDNGLEFVNSTCSELFNSPGMVNQRTCVYTPQQNGVAERKHRHILEVARAVRFQAHIPPKYWGHCVLAAVHVINKMPSLVLNGVSPFQKVYNRQPSLEHLRVLGCLCYAKAVQERDKLMPRAITAVMMGYAATQKGYVLLKLTNHCFFVNGDVIFQKTVFPFRHARSKYSPLSAV